MNPSTRPLRCKIKATIQASYVTRWQWVDAPCHRLLEAQGIKVGFWPNSAVVTTLSLSKSRRTRKIISSLILVFESGCCQWFPAFRSPPSNATLIPLELVPYFISYRFSALSPVGGLNQCEREACVIHGIGRSGTEPLNQESF